MRTLAAFLCLAVALVLVGCGESVVELVVRGQGPDGCAYEGPTRIQPGPVELGASPSGLGQISVSLREVKSAGEEVDMSNLGPIVARVENEDEISLATAPAELSEGEYAITCHYEGFDGVVGTLTVTP